MKKILVISFFMLFIYGCAEKAPVTPDGEAQMKITAFWNNSQDSIPEYLPMANAQVIMSSEYGIMIKYTDNNGVLNLPGIPSSIYNVSVRMDHPSNPDIMLVAAITSIETFSGKIYANTVYAKPFFKSGITINELYISGSAGSRNYFYDQFIELYNSSGTTKYLDGMMIMKFAGNSTENGFKGQGADEGDDGDIDGVTYVFKFPGKPGGRNYPFPPKKFLTVATIAIDHRKSAPQSIDLSKADWEFYNQYSAGEMDNPNVPNLNNMRADNNKDFYFDLQSSVIVLSFGADSCWQDGIDINTIIDGVEYQYSASARKTLDSRIDKSFFITPPRYSSQSMQRRHPGGDTDDCSLDWGIISRSTPGYQ